MQTGFAPLLNPFLYHRQLIEIPVKYIVESIPDIGEFDLTLKPPLSNGVKLELDFKTGKDGKYMEGDNWVIPCSLSDKDGSYVWKYEVVVDPAKEVSLRKIIEKDWILDAQGKVVKPLNSIGEDEAKNIMVSTDRKLLDPKLGENVLDLWPLVTGLIDRYPGATIHLDCDFPEMFRPEMFKGRVKLVGRERRQLMRESPQEQNRYLDENDIDMLFIVSISPRLTSRQSRILMEENTQRYIFEMYASSSRMGAVSPEMHDAIKPIRFFDRKGKVHEVSGTEKIMDKIAAPISQKGPEETGEYNWKFKRSGGWLLSIEMCRLLGLNVARDNMKSMKPSYQESIAALKWLEDIYSESGEKDTPAGFDPTKKIILVNVYAVTQSRLLSEEDWADVVVEIIRNSRDSYIVFTGGGRMDLDVHYATRIVDRVLQKLGQKRDYDLAARGNEILLPRKDIYPHIHSLLSVSSAVVTLDTGMSHLASGAYNIPTAIITTPAIEHWLPPRRNVIPIFGLNVFDMTGKILLLAPEAAASRRERMIKDTREFMKEINEKPERDGAVMAKIAAATFSERMTLDEELVERHSFECKTAFDDLADFLFKTVRKLGLPDHFMPEIVFVDSAPQTGIGLARFDAKLFVSGEKTILLVDRGVLYRAADGELYVKEEAKKIDILHEVLGHSFARHLFSNFNKVREEERKNQEEMSGGTLFPLFDYFLIYKTEEEIVSWLLMLGCVQRLVDLEPDFYGPQLLGKISGWGIDIHSRELVRNLRDVMKAVEKVNAISTLRYSSVLRNHAKDLEKTVVQEYLPAIRETLERIDDIVGRKEEEGSDDDGLIERPLAKIPGDEIKNILVFSEERRLGPKLGETAINLWPVVTALTRKFPGAKVHVVTDFADLFRPKMFGKKINVIDTDVMDKIRRSPDALTAFLVENDIDLALDISCVAAYFSHMAPGDFPSGRMPYVISVHSPTSMMSAFDTTLMMHEAAGTFRDRDGNEKQIAGHMEMIEKVAKYYYSRSMMGEAKYSWNLIDAGGWLMSIEMCRQLGLDITSADMEYIRPTPEETIGALKWLQGVYEETNPGKTFYPAKKIIIVNVYAVTQRDLLSEDEWVSLITELMKGVKGAYLVFTSGGKMDVGEEYIEGIIGNVMMNLRHDKGYADSGNGTEIVMPRRNIYPFIHSLLTISSAVVTLDTGLSHMSSGAYNIPTAVITKPSILHWLPPRENVVPIVSLKDIRYGISSFRVVMAGKEQNRERIIGATREFVEKVNSEPEREPVHLAKFSVAFVNERRELDEKLIREHSFESETAKEDLGIFLHECLSFFGLPDSLIPEIRFVDSAAETGVGVPRFAVKIFKPDEKNTYLLVDRSTLDSRGKDVFVKDGIKKFEIFHEIIGHMFVRSVFREFLENHLKAIRLKGDRPNGQGGGKHRQILEKKAEEEILSWLMTFAALQMINHDNPGFISDEIKEKVSRIGIDITEPDVSLHIKKVVEWVKKANVLSAIRYKTVLDKNEEEIKRNILEKYLPDLLSILNIKDVDGGISKTGASAVRDLRDQTELATALVENMLSLFTKKKVVLAFDKKLAGADAALVRAVFDELAELKKDPKYEKLLANLEVVSAAAGYLPRKLKDYIGDKDTEIFLFARETERGKLRRLEGKVHSVYVKDHVKDKEFPEGAYYPLAEIVTITLSEFLSPGALASVKSQLAGINILDIGEEDGALVFLLLPEAKKFDSREELIKKYANLKRILRSV